MGGASQAQLYNAFGAYVHSQRKLAQLTLRQAAELASISNPYLSQIEHGMALPSISVLSSLADALSVSAETMLLRAAGLASSKDAAPSSHTEESILQDSRLDNGQKHALLAVLASFVGSPAGEAPRSPEQPEAHRDLVTPTNGAVRPAAAARASSNRTEGE